MPEPELQAHEILAFGAELQELCQNLLQNVSLIGNYRLQLWTDINEILRESPFRKGILYQSD